VIIWYRKKLEHCQSLYTFSTGIVLQKQYILCTNFWTERAVIFVITCSWIGYETVEIIAGWQTSLIRADCSTGKYHVWQLIEQLLIIFVCCSRFAYEVTEVFFLQNFTPWL